MALLVAAGILAAVLYSRGDDNATTTQAGAEDDRQDGHEPGHDRAPDRHGRAAAGLDDGTVDTTPTTTASSGASGSALNDAGYAKMQAGDLAGALPLLEQAVAKLSGTGSTTEAYAAYNLAYTRYSLGNCTDVVTLLDALGVDPGATPGDRPVAEGRREALLTN